MFRNTLFSPSKHHGTWSQDKWSIQKTHNLRKKTQDVVAKYIEQLSPREKKPRLSEDKENVGRAVFGIKKALTLQKMIKGMEISCTNEAFQIHIS
jgi:hypothetical protein